MNKSSYGNRMKRLAAQCISIFIFALSGAVNAQQLDAFFPPVGVETWIDVPDMSKPPLAEKAKSYVFLIDEALKFQAAASEDFPKALAEYMGRGGEAQAYQLDPTGISLIQGSMQNAILFAAHVDSDSPLIFFYSPVSDMLLATSWNQGRGMTAIRYLIGNQVLGLNSKAPTAGISNANNGTSFPGPLGRMVAAYRRVAEKIWQRHPFVLAGRTAEQLPDNEEVKSFTERIYLGFTAMGQMSNEVLGNEQWLKQFDAWAKLVAKGDLPALQKTMSPESPLKAEFILGLPSLYRQDQNAFFAVKSSGGTFVSTMLTASQAFPFYWLEFSIGKDGMIYSTAAISANTFVK